MATDGRRIVYNPAFVEKLTSPELEGVLAHECLHVGLAHHCRRGERDAELWNRAADYAVNPILINNGITLPKDALIDPAFAALSAEEIYARLLKLEQDSGKADAPPESSAQPATSGGVGNDPQRAAQSVPQSRNHRSKNRKIRPNRREFRPSPLRRDQEASARFWMRSAKTASQHRRPS